MEYLISIGISEDTINYLKKHCTKIEINSMNNCIDRLESSILYLREIGVNNNTIESILKEDYHVLMPGKKYLEISLSKVRDIKEFVILINENIEYMEYLRYIV